MRPSLSWPKLAALFALVCVFVVSQRASHADSMTSSFETTSVSVKEISLDGLRSSLRETDAIGFTTKLSLKHDLDSLLDSFDDYHQGRGEESLPSLRERFATLLTATLALLKDDDPKLFQRLWDAQGHLWLIVSDPVRFQAAVNAEKGNRVAFQRND